MLFHRDSVTYFNKAMTARKKSVAHWWRKRKDDAIEISSAQMTGNLTTQMPHHTMRCFAGTIFRECCAFANSVMGNPWLTTIRECSALIDHATIVRISRYLFVKSDDFIWKKIYFQRLRELQTKVHSVFKYCLRNGKTFFRLLLKTWLITQNLISSDIKHRQISGFSKESPLPLL